MRDLKRAGVDVPGVTRELLKEGIGQFIESLNDILQTIATKAVTTPSGGPLSSADRANLAADRWRAV